MTSTGFFFFFGASGRSSPQVASLKSRSWTHCVHLNVALQAARHHKNAIPAPERTFYPYGCQECNGKPRASACRSAW